MHSNTTAAEDSREQTVAATQPTTIKLCIKISNMLCLEISALMCGEQAEAWAEGHADA